MERKIESVQILFINEGVQSIFGVLLLHQHFLILIVTNQRLVAFSNVSTPLVFHGRNEQALANQHCLQPRSYCLFGGKFVAIDFTLQLGPSVDITGPSVDVTKSFFVKAAKLFTELRVERILGLRRLENMGTLLNVGCQIDRNTKAMLSYSEITLLLGLS
jgi:hypothetical protein